MVVRVRELISLVWDTRVENERNSLMDQPGHMSVRKFCRVTFGFAWDGLDAKLIYLSGGWRRKYHAIFQSREKFKPEWIIFVHIEDTRDADGTSYCFICLQWFAVKQKFVFIFEKVRDFFFISLFSDTTLTAVSGHKLTTPGKTVDGQAAVVGTALAFCHGGRELELIDLFNGKHGGLYTVLITLTGDQGSAESSHDAGNIRADCLTSGNLFETS